MQVYQGGEQLAAVALHDGLGLGKILGIKRIKSALLLDHVADHLGDQLAVFDNKNFGQHAAYHW